METGVHIQKSVIDFSNVPKYLKWLLSQQDKTRSITSGPNVYCGPLVPRLRKALRQYEERDALGVDFFDRLAEVLFEFGAFSECLEICRNARCSPWHNNYG